MIELSEVTKRYGRKGAAPEALRELSLTLSPGTVWAVVGPNGAGKSTLLSVRQAAVARDLSRVQTIVDDADAQEERARNEAMAQHHDHRAFQALNIEGEQTERNERHMRD